jgi:hypothetical protein
MPDPDERGGLAQPAPAVRRVGLEFGHAAFDHRQRDRLTGYRSALEYVDGDELGRLLHEHDVSVCHLVVLVLKRLLGLAPERQPPTRQDASRGDRRP